MAQNLWPDFPMGKRRTIKTILREVGSGIEDRTAGTIQFHIETALEKPGKFTHHCQLFVVPIDYFYPLLTASHAINMFPVTTVADPLGRPVVSQNEAEFINVLQTIITSAATRNVVQQLLDAVV